MIALEDARAGVLAGLAPLPAEEVPLAAALGRRLAAGGFAAGRRLVRRAPGD